MSVIGVDMRRIGLWLTKTEIVFALVEPDGQVVMRGRVPRTPRGREALLDTYPPNLEIVGTTGVRNSANRVDPILSLATDLGTPCWYVRAELILALRTAIGIQDQPLETTAALLACLPDARHHVIAVAGGNLPLFPGSVLGDRHGNT
jgi:hypothetical protein